MPWSQPWRSGIVMLAPGGRSRLRCIVLPDQISNCIRDGMRSNVGQPVNRTLFKILLYGTAPRRCFRRVDRNSEPRSFCAKLAVVIPDLRVNDYRLIDSIPVNRSLGCTPFLFDLETLGGLEQSG